MASNIEIQLCADAEEERVFREQENFPWPRLGMCCQVPRCPNMSLFLTYNKYVDHFASCHRSFLIKYKCSICSKIISKLSKCSHKKSHKNSSVLYEHVKVVNPSFIDPGAIVLPVPPSTVLRPSEVEEDPEFLSHKRAEMAKKRRDFSDFNSCSVSQAEIMEKFESSIFSP